jgi:hypothetical protein
MLPGLAGIRSDISSDYFVVQRSVNLVAVAAKSGRANTYPLAQYRHRLVTLQDFDRFVRRIQLRLWSSVWNRRFGRLLGVLSLAIVLVQKLRLDSC